MSEPSEIKAQRLVSDLVLQPPEEVASWIGNGILPKGGKMIFGGPTKIGKTFISITLGRDLALGQPIFGCPLMGVPERCKVLLFEEELGKEVLGQRVRPLFERYLGTNKLVQELDERLFFVSKERLDFSCPAGLRIIQSLIADVKPNVLILDPIGKMQYYDENSNSEVNKLFGTFDGLMKEHRQDGLAIVLSHHFGKMSTNPNFQVRDPLDPSNFRGAIRWTTDPDTLVTAYRIHPDLITNRGDATSYKWWKVKTRWTTRACEQPDDMILSINELGDMEARFSAWQKVYGGQGVLK